MNLISDNFSFALQDPFHFSLCDDISQLEKLWMFLRRIK